MGLISSLSNAVSGLRTSQDSISVLSRNVANAGTPGYHKQALNIVDYNSANGTYARTTGINRAFNQSLQTYYNRQVADTSAAAVKGDYLNKLQAFLGKPGQTGSLDTMFGSFKNSLQALATSPDDFSSRANVVAEAQAMAQRLNMLSGMVQELRQEAEAQIATNVVEVNAMLTSLNEVNNRMLDLGMTDTARAALMDQRDRLVAGIAGIIDVQADYRPNGTVALMTRSGVGLIDNGASTFKFTSAGALSPSAQASMDSTDNRVGTLQLVTPSGVNVDLIRQGVLQGGELAGLVELRDKILVEAQNQLDDIAAALARSFSTITTPGSAASDGSGRTGLVADISHLQPGNDVYLTYTVNGAEQRVRIVNSTNGEDFIDASGQRVISVDLSDSAGAAAILQNKLNGPSVAIRITSPAPGQLQVLDDGPGGSRDITGLTTRGTAAGMQTGEMAMALFVDQSGAPFTGNLDTDPPQILGFAARIAINPAVVADNRLLVQFDLDTSLGDASRPEYVLKQLNSMSFLSGTTKENSASRHQLNGNVEQLIGQVLNYQGTTIGSALTQRADRMLTLDTITSQMESEYGVNMDEEMARLTELQSAYAANARIVAVVKELLDTLFRST